MKEWSCQHFPFVEEELRHLTEELIHEQEEEEEAREDTELHCEFVVGWIVQVEMIVLSSLIILSLNILRANLTF